jgi:nucleoside-diphosphate-sugar epimerase
MIVGKGLLATAFHERFAADPSVMIFASGVSDSTTDDQAAFERERSLLEHALQTWPGRVVYFSSCAAGDPATAISPYLQHKRRMEASVLGRDHTTIFRLPQVVGRTDNPSTLTNFLYDRISNEKRFTVWTRAERNLIDVDDVASIGAGLVNDPGIDERVISIAAPRSLPILSIIDIFEMVLGQKASFDSVDKGDALHIECSIAQRAAKDAGVEFGADYSERVIRKYYGHLAS